MPVRQGGCRTCNIPTLAGGSTQTIDEKVASVLREERSMSDLVRELVTLRATHNCQLEEEIAELRNEVSFLQFELQHAHNQTHLLREALDESEKDCESHREALDVAASERDRALTKVYLLQRDQHLVEEVSRKDRDKC